MKEQQYSNGLKFHLALCPDSDSCQYRLMREEGQGFRESYSDNLPEFSQPLLVVSDELCECR